MNVVRGHSESYSIFLKVTLVQTLEMTAPVASRKDVFAKQTYLSLALHHNLSFKYRAFPLISKQCPLNMNTHSSACPSETYCCYILGLTHSSACLVCLFCIGERAFGLVYRVVHLFLCAGSLQSWVGGRERCCRLLMLLPILRRTCALEVSLFFIPVIPEHLPCMHVISLSSRM